MSQDLKNVAPKNAAKPGAVSAVPMQAGLLLIGGATVALLFGGGTTQPQAAPTDMQPALVRRAAPLPPTVEAPVTQLLGYVNETTPRSTPSADAPSTDALQLIGISARPEKRTAARVDAQTQLSQLDAPPALQPAPMMMAAAGPAPRAMMRPYGASSAGGQEAARPGLSATPTNAARKHVVRDGDTLGGLAEQYYGDARRYKELFAANRDLLSNPELLPIGATLQIPAFDPMAVQNVAPPTGARLLPQVLLRNP